MLAQWDPFAELNKLHSHFARTNPDSQAFRPAVDIYEDDKGVHVDAELAGMSPEDIKVDVENNVLTISGERKMEKESDDKGYHRVERFYGSFSRSFAIGDDINADAIDAKYSDGVLRLLLPKRPEVKPRKVQIKAS